MQDAGRKIDLREMGYILLRNAGLIAAVTVLTIGVAALVTYRETPIYRSGVTLRIDDQDAGRQLLGDMAPIVGIGRGKLETEMMVLRSRHIAESVVDSLKLTVALLEPAVPREDVLLPLRAPRDATPGIYELRHKGDGSYDAFRVGDDGESRLAQGVRPGAPVKLGDVEVALAPEVAQSRPKTVRVQVRTFRQTVYSIRTGVNVFRPDANAQVVAIEYRSPDRRLAAAVPDAVSSAFIRYKNQGSKTESRSAVSFLREQVASYEAQLQGAEDQLRGFRERQQVVSLTDEASQQVQRLSQLQAEVEQLRAERETLTRLLAEVAASAPGRTGTAKYRQLASFPVFLANRAVQDMLQTLSELENRRADLLVRRQPGNEDVQGLEKRIAEIELQLYQIARHYLDSLESQLTSKQSTLARFGTQLQAIPSREIEFARRSRQQGLLAEIYTLLQTRLKEAEIREAIEPGDVRVIDSALVPEAPISPRPMQNMVAGVVLGLLLGCGLALARHAMDTKVRTREDAEAATAGAPVLGTIPRIRVAGVAGANGNGNGRKKARVAPVTAQEFLGETLVTRIDPLSPAAEAYRALRTNVTFASAERSPQVLVITSALPGDGKSTSAANLAITLAQQGTRTLLVDADLRRGVLHKVFDVESDPGLTHLLLGRATLEEAVRTIPTGGETALTLDLLPAGIFPPNPAEMVGSARMRDLLAKLRDVYEVIVFDAPPLNLVTDAAILGTLADTTMLVARTGNTDKRALEYAAGQIHHVGARLGGVILNDINLDGRGYYGSGYGYSYGYGYGATYGGNGSTK
jgi:tyrosine-protein kinase Etk/Wzc